jgi:hypothetical protein
LSGNLPGVVAQRIGDASYSLYLAHFPVIVLVNYQPFSGTRLGLSAWTLPLIAIATLALYFGLERRGPKLFSVKRSLAAVAVVSLLAAALPPVELLRFGGKQRLVFAAAEDRSAYHCGKLFRILHARQKFCRLGSGKPIMLVGDSHADALKLSFARVAEKHGWATFFPTDNDALLSPALSARWLKRQADTIGASWVFLHYSPLNFSPDLVERARRELGNRLIVIEPTPIFSDNVPKALFEGRSVHAALPSGRLEAYLKLHPEIPVVRLMPSMCPTGCRLVDAAGHPFYWDRDHLTLTGAKQLEPKFEALFEKLSRVR